MAANASIYADALEAHVLEAMCAIGLSVAALVAVLAFACLKRSGGHRGGGWLLALALLPFGPFLFRPAPELDIPRAGALTFHARAYRWRWEIVSPGGITDGQLYVPRGRPIHLVLTSNGEDPTLHSFHVPGLGLRADVVPGRPTELWFVADRVGEHQVYCGELCGAGHSRMLTTLVVIEREDLERPPGCVGLVPDLPAAGWGELLFTNSGCPACHSVDSSDATPYGPDLADIAMRPRDLADGAVVTADADYLLASITQPQEQLLVGYDDHPSMPAFNLRRSELEALVAYLFSLSSSEEIREQGRQRFDRD